MKENTQSTRLVYGGKGRTEKKNCGGAGESTGVSNLTTHVGDAPGAYVSIDIQA